MDEITVDQEITNAADLMSDPSVSYEHEMEGENEDQQEILQEEACENSEERRPNKRDREEEDEEGWTEVRGSKGKKYKEEKIEIYISSKDRLPKQFALAKIFKDEGIMSIQKIRYINPYKIRVDMNDENSAGLLERCKEVIDKGWRIQRAMEVNMSYGVIRDVDLDLTEEEMMNRIICSEPAQLVSVQRLMRRNVEGEGWTSSESVRLCFKGSFRPAYISVDGLRIRVEQYTFPVTQCSRCWKLGHTKQRCPSAKVICPKCSENHDNCDTTLFKCTNCNGPHMALVRSCPAYLKEKRLRELMAEFNCTYRRALTIYIPDKKTKPVEPVEVKDISATQAGKLSFSACLQQHCTEVEMPLQTAMMNSQHESAKKDTLKHHKQKRSKKPNEVELEEQVEAVNSHDVLNEEENKTREVQFSELLSRLKEILFLKGETVHQKVQSCIKCCIQWVILVLVENISDWPILKVILDYFGYNE